MPSRSTTWCVASASRNTPDFQCAHVRLCLDCTQGVRYLLSAAAASKTCKRIVRVTGKGETPFSIFSVLINTLGSMAKAWNYEGECVPTPAAPAPA